MHIAPFAAALLLTLAACSSSSSPEPDTTTIAGDGDGDQGDGDGDETSEPMPDMGEPLLDVPSEGFEACCFCIQNGWCEAETYASPDECANAQPGVESEWHTDCYEDPDWGVVCPSSCVAP